MTASDLTSCSDDDDDGPWDPNHWERENHEQLLAMYQQFMAMGQAWFGSGFYRTGGYYHFTNFVKSFYTQRHLF